ncbi:MAG TPA: DUF3089 domain-containing protein [Cyclobacteriaceae bacterium]|nr:DUF3089 domain-containing protein [Cyclobacteriaceae bacterium]
MFRLCLASTLLILFAFCSNKVNILKNGFRQSLSPPSPDYSKSASWASLPTKRDAADSTPKDSNLKNTQSSAQADVFFIYPTVFVGKPTNRFQWNADVNDSILNYRIQITTILNQASIFNEACRIYSPYYRQAHLYAFYTRHTEDGDSALNVAYKDVKSAFDYYLKNFNHDRPIIIASHSQGSYHAERLLRDYFDGKELYRKLVVAYLIGRPIKPDAFTHILPTKKPEEIGVWISWNTFGRNFIPYDYIRFKGALCINPLLWNSSEAFAAKDLNKGSVALKFTFKPHFVDAQNHLGLLWISRPQLRGSLWVRNRSWHRADMNFFYMNIRENVALRIKTYLEKGKVVAAVP